MDDLWMLYCAYGLAIIGIVLLGFGLVRRQSRDKTKEYGIPRVPDETISRLVLEEKPAVPVQEVLMMPAPTPGIVPLMPTTTMDILHFAWANPDKETFTIRYVFGDQIIEGIVFRTKRDKRDRSSHLEDKVEILSVKYPISPRDTPCSPQKAYSTAQRIAAELKKAS